MSIRCRMTLWFTAATVAVSILSHSSNLRSQPTIPEGVQSQIPSQDPFEGLRLALGGRERELNEKEKEVMYKLAQSPEVKSEVQQNLIEQRERDRALARVYNLGDDNDLYNNPVVAEWINQAGQALVPPHSKNTYVFRIREDPLPSSQSSVSGSIYITTGMLALLGSEGQLAFILAHEIAHIERDHFYHRLVGQAVETRLPEALKSRRGIGSILKGAAGGLVAASTEGFLGDTGSKLLGLAVHEALKGPGLPPPTDWNQLQEEDADRYGLRLALQAQYDISDAVGLLMALRREIQEDPRIEAKLHLNSIPIEDRIAQVSRILAEDLSDLWEEKKGNLLGTSPRFQFMIAEVRRDNGIQAVHEDLFAMARRNLERSVAIRSDDARTHHYLGKVYTWARREDLSLKAEHHFEEAIRWDRERNLMPEPHYDLALLLMREDDPRRFPRIQKELRTYVRMFVKNNRYYGRSGDALPKGMPLIYDRLRLIGDSKWRLEDDLETAVQQSKPMVN